jgi:hypothetical protein
VRQTESGMRHLRVSVAEEEQVMVAAEESPQVHTVGQAVASRSHTGREGGD